MFRATTILAVKRNGRIAIGGDGQVNLRRLLEHRRGDHKNNQQTKTQVQQRRDVDFAHRLDAVFSVECAGTACHGGPIIRRSSKD